MTFTIYPAIDLCKGQVVRLRQGDPNKQKEYSNDPVEIAKKWQAQGATWFHLINLDGAFGEYIEPNQRAIKNILVACGDISTQLGGGIRSLADIEGALNLGITRVILGTAILEDFSFAKKVIAEFGADRIVFGLDARDGVLMARGWQVASDRSIFELAEALKNIGAERIIYTDIATDGMSVGNDTKNTRQLAEKTGLDVIASGGIKTLEDVREVKEAGLSGVIIGRALYENHITLAEAIAC
ncbi:MAG: 1-(5-phosphoribosyl)-5-[(5-phosphoribosylamino)methylideneamino]imidazole-4-carboxamide isomerase [Anaerolineae bacterium]|jgi:phosphoribosylformimino-5-aminoimidazole carboxamide ribotide isomerase|nr:1-(5-phosphoribosyl)-5-[(5-phosphoribosylamino)methylideneamino]imidazole-4-carboxamide isomerase [Anaerolineae bacterium]MBT7071036.1 1-(5-phosphoribosyl)-5-[(5-phosphoribosylamino)methylideneamino]imidazole-4-carboxamide isomerase [Anaerolineae bacterium]MBT7323742.1 1-(5-phosphoribosyl)-5-[(5-phosphoribosylamino)methylideneamino]imidazole-4-carboxamide isomerase [Anaerolineae bacterium]